MSIYKEASRLRLRFPTTSGMLTVEQLWDFKLTPLSDMIRNQKKVLKKTEDDDDLAFLDTKTSTDPVEKLRFDILKDIYVTKQTEADALKEAKDAKEHNAKIIELIAKKKEGALEGKTIEELEAMLK